MKSPTGFDRTELETPELPDDRVVVLLARPGGGKTSVSIDRLEKFDRVFVLDQQVRDGRGEYNLRVARTPDEAAQGIEELADGLPRRISYRGPLVEEGPRDPINIAIFDALAELEDVLIVVEEADRVMESKWAPPGLYSMAHHGRRFGQCLTLCSRRPANISKDVTATADVVSFWNVTEPADRDYAKSRGFPLEVLDGLKGHQSLRRFYTEDGVPEFYLCSCNVAHTGRCGKPLAVGPVKLEAPEGPDPAIAKGE